MLSVEFCSLGFYPECSRLEESKLRSKGETVIVNVKGFWQFDLRSVASMVDVACSALLVQHCLFSGLEGRRCLFSAACLRASMVDVDC